MDTIISATLCTEVLSTIGNTIYLHGKLWSILGHVRAFNLVQKMKEHYQIAFCLYSFFSSTYNKLIFLSEMFFETFDFSDSFFLVYNRQLWMSLTIY